MQNRKCYARILDDCSGKISREHYFSNSVLSILNRNLDLKLEGFPWQTPGVNPGPKALTAKVLCEDHNNRLHDLDDAALKVFGFFEESKAKLHSETSHDNLVCEVSGDQFELWILKYFAGLMASGNLRTQTDPFPKSDPQLSWVQLLFQEIGMPHNWGLYCISSADDEVFRYSGMGFAPIISQGNPIGALIELYGLKFLLVLANPAPSRSNTLLDGAFYRPSYLRLILNSGVGYCALKLAWKDSVNRPGVDIKLGPYLHISQ